MFMSKYKDLAIAIENGDLKEAVKLTEELINEGAEAKKIIDDALIMGMESVGKKFQRNEIFVPEMLIAAKTMQESMKILEPMLKESDRDSKIKFVLGTVEGDLHDIGKDLVAMMLEGAGFEVIDLGIDVAPVDFVDAIKKYDAQLVGMSSLLTTTMPKMKETINAISEAGLRDKIKILVGGAPVTEDYAEQIGADAYASDASNATEVAKSLI